jgi:hypothetical protein
MNKNTNGSNGVTILQKKTDTTIMHSFIKYTKQQCFNILDNHDPPALAVFPLLLPFPPWNL